MERFFFHSFPRLRYGETRDAQIAKGLLIADSLLQNGLLLSPENYEIPIVAPNGAVVDRLKATQRRACFTELESQGLPSHAALFGPFALVYRIEDLRRLGALPVFYIPLETQGANLSGLATELLSGFIDASRIISSLVMVRRHLAQSPTLKLDYRGRSVEFSPDAWDAIKFFIDTLMDSARTDAGVTESRLRAISSCFYPTENPKYTEPLHYYRQREWRIVAGSFTFKGHEPSTKATAEQVSTLLGIDSDFFSKQLSFFNPTAGIGAEEVDTVARRSHFFRTLGDLDVIGSARFFVHPDECSIPESLRQVFAARGIQILPQGEFCKPSEHSSSSESVA
jgi:hypothetical protein